MKRQIMDDTAQEERKAKREKQIENREMTLLSAIEQIAISAKDSALCEKFYKQNAKQILYIAQRLQISEREAVILAVLANFYNEWNSISDLAHYVDCHRLHMLYYAAELESLRKKCYVKLNSRGDKERYKISADTLKAIRQNEVPQPLDLKVADILELFDLLNKFIHQRKIEDVNYHEFVEMVQELLTTNASLSFAREIKSLGLNDADLTLLLWGCNMAINNDDMVIVPSDYESLYEGEGPLFRRQVRALKRGDSVLIKKGLFQLMDDDGRAHSDALTLTSYVCEELLQDMGIVSPIKKDNCLTSHSEIVAKELFYNPKEERSLSQLRSMLAPEQFDNICKRLNKKGMRKGFACLFYGAPGTGKTETVLQLARQTERDIMQVNISEINSKWVGESEKNIKALFDRYRRLVKKSERAPILFFNEADALINKRNANAERAVDKMENAMQNIILQEMESLEGIMIATTNLTSNMDSAFERRSIYKIEFEKPSLEVKQTIWRSMLPTLSEADAKMLATKYDFSGGQIENIARKQTVEEILTGEELNINRIVEFCNAERLSNSTVRSRIGF